MVGKLRTLQRRRRASSRCALALVAAALVFHPSDTVAESLGEALVAAYVNNPTLKADQSRQRGTDEEASIARSGWRPTVIARGQVVQVDSETHPTTAGRHNRSHGYAIELSQPIFSGFQTVNSTRAADAIIEAGRARLLGTEQQVLLRAVEEYVNVVRDKAIVALRTRHKNILGSVLRGTRERLAANEVTRTDFAQALSRRAAAMSAFNLSRANLQTSRASYRDVVGHAPAGLRQPPAHATHIPNSPSDAAALAEQNAPSVLSASFSAKAAVHTADRIRGELLPQVDVRARYGQDFGPSEFLRRNEDLSLSAHLTMPLLTNGETEARVRQARHEAARQTRLYEQAKSTSRATAASAWAQLSAARIAVQADRQRVTASRSALSGVREEENAGQRTVLDVLNAHEELLLAQIQLVTNQRNHVLASYNVLAAIGKLTVADLGLSTATHDPIAHYEDARRQWLGVEVNYGDGRHEYIEGDVVVIE